ncbi:MAG: hypothetical protein AAGG02_17215 [Cyanobacteria bacterium P01_H01_bin.15]
MKLANPLNYPLMVLAGGVVLVLGVRLARVPLAIALPVSAAVSVLGSSTVATRKPPGLDLDNPQLERELTSVKQQAIALSTQAEALRVEASKSLESSEDLDLLTTVQYACDRVLELPRKIDSLSRRLHGGDSLLSVDEIQRQLRDVQRKQIQASGMVRQQLDQLAISLTRNLQLAKQGEDARQAQVTALSTLIVDGAGTLQSLQNQLRTSDFTDSSKRAELQSLSEELKQFQENMDILVD